MPHHDADIVQRADQEHHQQREPEPLGDAEDDRGRAETRDRPEQRHAGTTQRRPMGQQHGHANRPDHVGRHEHAVPSRTHVKHGGIDGHEIRDAAQQHGEQIERDRGQNQGSVPDEANARHHALPRNRLLRVTAGRYRIREIAAIAAMRQSNTKAKIGAMRVETSPSWLRRRQGPVTEAM